MTNIEKEEDINPDWLRGFSGFENISDEEALHIIETLKTYCQIIFKVIESEEE